jgi:hypothetical protein
VVFPTPDQRGFLVIHLHRYASENIMDQRQTLSRCGLWRLDEILPAAVADLLASREAPPVKDFAIDRRDLTPLAELLSVESRSGLGLDAPTLLSAADTL